MKKTQHELILDYIKENGSITPRQAADALGCLKLATRIGELKQAGYNIVGTMERGRDRYGMPVRYMRYTMNEQG